MPTRIEIAEQKQITALRDLEREGGIVAKSAWSTGKGRYIKARDIPFGADKHSRLSYKQPAEVVAWFEKHPRAENCIAINTQGQSILAAHDQKQRENRAKEWFAA